MAVHRQWALPFSVDHQDPQLPVVAGHVGGARGVHAQTLGGGAVLHAAVSSVIAAIFFREANEYRENNGFNSLFAQRDTVCTLYTLVSWKKYILTFFLSNIYS